MDAPIYPPAQAYFAPVRVPHALSTRTVAFGELFDDPEARAILEREIPGIAERVGMGPLSNHRDALTMRSLVTFGLVRADALDRVDVELDKLNAARGTKR